MTSPTDVIGFTPPWARNERESDYRGTPQWSYLTTFVGHEALSDLDRIRANGYRITIRGHHTGSVLIFINQERND